MPTGSLTSGVRRRAPASACESLIDVSDAMKGDGGPAGVEGGLDETPLLGQANARGTAL